MSLAAATAALCVGACGGHGSSAARYRLRAVTSAAAASPVRANHRTAFGRVRLAYHPLYNLAAPVQDPASAALGSNRFVLLGGLTEADTSSNAVIEGGMRNSTATASLPNAQHDAQAAELGRNVYVFGGGQFTQYDHILVYDPGSGRVEPAGILPTLESDVAVASNGSTAYVIGGFDGVNWLNTVVAFTPGRAPRVVAHLPVGVRYAAAADLGGHVVVAGGSTPGGTSNAIYRVVPSTGAVEKIGALPSGLTHAAAGAIGGTMYLVGGRDRLMQRTSTVWAIDPGSGAVHPVGSLPQSLSDEAVVSLGDRLVVAGGSSAAGTQAGVGELLPTDH